jgi:enediyne biosynthesis protein E4
LDLLGVGNFYWTDVVIGKYDALKGLTLLGDGKGNFRPVSLHQSGFVVDSDAKAISRIETSNNQSLFLIMQNLDSLKLFKDNTSVGLKRIQPTPMEAYAIIYFRNGSKQKNEFGYGSSYLSQSSRSIIVPKNAKKIEWFDNNGKPTRQTEF